MIDKIQFSELLIAKFCHDLAGQLGAINNGIEFLLEENEVMRQKAFKLVSTSSKQAIARLLFFRQAYGISSNIGETNLIELKELINNFLTDSKINLDWSDQNISSSKIIVNQKFSKIILNFVLLLQNVLIYGGTIKLELEKIENGKQLTIFAIDSNWKLDKSISDILLGSADNIEITTKNVQLFYTYELLKSLNILLDIHSEDSHLKFILKYIK